MTPIPKHKMTMEEYIEFDKNNEGRCEYFDGEVFDMAGGTLNHICARAWWMGAQRY